MNQYLAESFVDAVCCIADLCEVSLQDAMRILIILVLERLINEKSKR